MAQATEKTAPQPSTPRYVVLNMGRQKRKKIKQLKRGEGALLDAVNESVAEMKSDGTLSSEPDLVVVVVVKEKQKGARLPFIGAL
jgi:hypothetical protein